VPQLKIQDPTDEPMPRVQRAPSRLVKVTIRLSREHLKVLDDLRNNHQIEGNRAIRMAMSDFATAYHRNADHVVRRLLMEG
jgi:hypothetical protein